MKKLHSIISPYAITALLLTAVTLVLTIVSEVSPTAADYLNSVVCAPVREALASVTNLFPFSLFEILIILSPIILAAAIFFAVRRIRRGSFIVRYLFSLAATLGLLFSAYQLTIGIAYNATPVSDRLGIERAEVNEESLTVALDRIVSEINELSARIEYTADGHSDPGYTTDDISRLVLDSYEKFSDTDGFSKGFDSRVKPMIFSEIMTSLELTGIYFPFTGEANINDLYPTYDLCFTAAHELSHQRGILRENEANFMAFLLCYTSEDEYLNYSAALSIFSYLGSALYRTSPDKYFEYYNALAGGARADLAASRAVSLQYENSFLAELSDRVNDWFLKSNGTPGIVSYGMVVELAVAYLTEAE